MSFLVRSLDLEDFIKVLDQEKFIKFLREIFNFSYTKTRGDDGLYMWFGDTDWDMKSTCPMAHVGSVTFIFIDYTEEQVIEKYNRYYKLRAFL